MSSATVTTRVGKVVHVRLHIQPIVLRTYLNLLGAAPNASSRQAAKRLIQLPYLTREDSLATSEWTRMTTQTMLLIQM